MADNKIWVVDVKKSYDSNGLLTKDTVLLDSHLVDKSSLSKDEQDFLSQSMDYAAETSPKWLQSVKAWFSPVRVRVAAREKQPEII